ncbi:hypothetical protein BLAT2472_30654 [Burkholderia latens]
MAARGRRSALRFHSFGQDRKYTRRVPPEIEPDVIRPRCHRTRRECAAPGHGIPALMRRAVGRGTSANGNSVRICVASYTTVALDAEPDGRQPVSEMAPSFDPLLNLHRGWNAVVTKRKHLFSPLRESNPTRRMFDDSDLIIHDHSRQSVANTTFLQHSGTHCPRFSPKSRKKSGQAVSTVGNRMSDTTPA